MKRLLLILLCFGVLTFSYACSVTNKPTNSKSSQSDYKSSSLLAGDESDKDKSSLPEESVKSSSRDPSDEGWGKDHLI